MMKISSWEVEYDKFDNELVICVSLRVHNSSCSRNRVMYVDIRITGFSWYDTKRICILNLNCFIVDLVDLLRIYDIEKDSVLVFDDAIKLGIEYVRGHIRFKGKHISSYYMERGYVYYLNVYCDKIYEICNMSTLAIIKRLLDCGVIQKCSCRNYESLIYEEE